MKAVTGQLSIDSQLSGLIDYMESNIPADQLERTARNVASLAPLLWSDIRCVERNRVSLSETQPAASELERVRSCVGDGSGLEVDTIFAAHQQEAF